MRKISFRKILELAIENLSAGIIIMIFICSTIFTVDLFMATNNDLKQIIVIISWLIFSIIYIKIVTAIITK